MTDTPGKRFDGTSLGDDAAAAQHGERSAGIGYAGHDADLLFRQSSFVQGAAALALLGERGGPLHTV